MAVSSDILKLISLAQKAREQAYAPYSNFKVGSALLCEDGRIFSGCNVENSSYGLTICAERNALFKAISDGARNFKMIALTAGTVEPIVPCGACLQVLAEFSPRITVIMAGLDGNILEKNLSDLLPYRFVKTEST